MYSILIEKNALKHLEKIPKLDREGIVVVIQNLATQPRPVGSKKLVGREGWRIRVGHYRIIYEINDKVCSILVIDIGHRKDIYH